MPDLPHPPPPLLPDLPPPDLPLLPEEDELLLECQPPCQFGGEAHAAPQGLSSLEELDELPPLFPDFPEFPPDLPLFPLELEELEDQSSVAHPPPHPSLLRNSLSARLDSSMGAKSSAASATGIVDEAAASVTARIEP